MVMFTLTAAAEGAGAAAVPAAEGERLALPRDRQVLLRAVHPADAALEQAFVAALSPAARHLRFHMGISGLSDAMARALVNVDAERHVALVAEARSDGGRSILVADARYALVERAGEAVPATAEFAIVVADAWQGLGLGRALLLRLARRARRQGLKRLRGDVLRHNHRMQAVVQGLGGRIVEPLDDASIVIAHFDL
jgi:acetyltransferase